MSTYDPNQYPQGQYPPPPPPAAYMPMYTGPTYRTLRRINVGSAFKVGAVLSGLIWAVFGIFFVIFGLCGFLGSLSMLANNNASGGAGASAAGGVIFIIIYVIGILFYALVGGITSALYAGLYNLTARFTGGLQVDVS